MSEDSNLPDPIGKAALSFFQKLLGPVAEASEILSDKIRLYRWKSSLKILERANKIASDNGISANEVPLKFLIPFMEKSSLEDEDDDLVERWASLLANASNDHRHAKAIYPEILSRLSREEAIIIEKSASPFLETILNNPNSRDFENQMVMIAIRHIAAAIVGKITENILLTGEDRITLDGLRVAVGKIIEMDSGISIELVSVLYDNNQSYPVFCENHKIQNNMKSYDILISCGLLIRKSESLRTENSTISYSLIVPTPLGMAFVDSCKSPREKPVA